MSYKINYEYLAKMARVGDDDHRLLVSVISDMKNELRYHENQADELAYELQKVLAENRFLVQQLQEDL